MMTETKSARLDAIRGEIDRARGDLLNEKERLIAARVELERQINDLEAELRILDSLDRASESNAGPGEPTSLLVSGRNRPLRQRVIELLQHNGASLTSRQIREMLDLNQRESRNLGPVLNQLARLGKIRTAGRGSPWQLVGACSAA
jgi:hypothetical protein